MDLYPDCRQPISASLFAQPTAAYRGTPFWSWNGPLDETRLLQQLDDLAAMGMGGAHLHSRTGLSLPYLGDEFMRLVRSCVQHARQRGMLAWLYDEDRWPSGFAGGLATRDPQHRLRYLLFTPRSYAQDPGSMPPPSSRAERWRTGQGTLLARYLLRFDRGQLASCRRAGPDATPEPGEVAWHAYLEVCPPTSWYNHQAPLDVLSPAAVAQFIRHTHDVYARHVGEHFGATIPAIFTDEPLFTGKTFPSSADDQADQWMPWTDDLGDTLRAAHQLDILDHLPALFFDGLPDTPRVRWAFHDHLAERFRNAYAQPIADWCQRRGILMTGHLESEGALASQTARSGECMRFYQPMHLPGIDMLCDADEYSTALQARSVARQESRPGVMSELYGVTNWDFSFAGHKRQGDWQAALGITVRVHHLAWFTMAGEAKRDYPAPIDAHSPWWREYPLVENHFARLNVALTRGSPSARVAVVHPVESVWTHWGQADRHRAANDAAEDRFQSLIRWLLHGLIDFDFLAESLLPRQATAVHPSAHDAPAALAVGPMRYDTILVPALECIRGSTLDLLERCADAGVRIAFLGQVPDLVDGRPSPRARGLAARVDQRPHESVPVLDYLEPSRDLRVVRPNRQPVGHLLSQIRDDHGDRWTFLCNTHRTESPGLVHVELRGSWRAQLWDTLTGHAHDLPTVHHEGWSRAPWPCSAAGHALIRWQRTEASSTPALDARTDDAADRMLTGQWEHGAAPGKEIGRLAEPTAFALDEPNVLLLDRAEGSLDDGPWLPDCEVLRQDNRWRVQLGWGKITSRIAQPWAEPATPPTHRVRLRYRLRLGTPVASARLALERAADAAITLDGIAIPSTPQGSWVDHAIGTVALPPMTPGEHLLEVAMPYGPHTTLEWMYLLGDFGVRIEGRSAVVCAMPRRLFWGDLAAQGLPFYAGNVRYTVPLDHPGGRLRIQAHRFRAPLLRASLDGQDLGPIAFPPYMVDVPEVPAGSHELTITCFGNRRNAFGQVHHAQPERHRWWGPDSWRTEGSDWSEEYILPPHGILSSPILLRRD